MMDIYSNDKPSMKNIYESKYLETVRKDEYQRGKEMYKKARKPYKTGVVPMPADSSMFSNFNETTNDNDNNISLLSGEKMNINQFKHNNMQPFIKGNVTQNTNVEKFTQKLDMNTGVDKLYRRKREVENFNQPTTGYHNINGSKSYNDFMKSRAVAGMTGIQNNISPFEKTYVGPGLNQGYSSKGVGGYQQQSTLDYARPRSMDELRSKINQRDTIFEIPIKAPPKGTEQRGIVTAYNKNKPERTFDKTHDDYFRTTGAYTKDRSRAELAVKNTHRQDTLREYSGVPKMEFQKGMAFEDDHGRNNIIVYDNERQETETKTTVSNVTSIVKSLISPVVDALKYTLKEYTVDAPRAGGNAVAQIPKKLTVLDPADTPKTTVKETLVQDSDILNLTGPDGTYSAAHDIAKTTVKETLIHDSDHLNITLPVNTSYMKNEDKAKTTTKETLPVVETVGNFAGKSYKIVTYNPENMAKKTVKETTIKGSAELGYIGGVLNSILGGYATKEVDLRNSHKQFTVDNESVGIAKSTAEFRQVSREAEENAIIDGTREAQLIAAGHTPNPGNMNIAIDKNDVRMKTNKLVDDSYAAREAGNVGVIYQTSPEINECEITREQNMNNAYENRLDGSLMDSLKDNEFNININPILNIVA
jgi:hypothetical protein